MLPLHVEGVWKPRGLVKQFHGDFHPSHGMDFPYKIITSAGGDLGFLFFFGSPHPSPPFWKYPWFSSHTVFSSWWFQPPIIEKNESNWKSSLKIGVKYLKPPPSFEINTPRGLVRKIEAFLCRGYDQRNVPRRWPESHTRMLDVWYIYQALSWTVWYIYQHLSWTVWHIYQHLPWTVWYIYQHLSWTVWYIYQHLSWIVWHIYQHLSWTVWYIYQHLSWTVWYIYQHLSWTVWYIYQHLSWTVWYIYQHLSWTVWYIYQHLSWTVWYIYQHLSWTVWYIYQHLSWTVWYIYLHVSWTLANVGKYTIHWASGIEFGFDLLERDIILVGIYGSWILIMVLYIIPMIQTIYRYSLITYVTQLSRFLSMFWTPLTYWNILKAMNWNEHFLLFFNLFEGVSGLWNPTFRTVPFRLFAEPLALYTVFPLLAENPFWCLLFICEMVWTNFDWTATD